MQTYRIAKAYFAFLGRQTKVLKDLVQVSSSEAKWMQDLARNTPGYSARFGERGIFPALAFQFSR